MRECGRRSLHLHVHPILRLHERLCRLRSRLTVANAIPS
jgi:hypothetical protein